MVCTLILTRSGQTWKQAAFLRLRLAQIGIGPTFLRHDAPSALRSTLLGRPLLYRPLLPSFAVHFQCCRGPAHICRPPHAGTVLLWRELSSSSAAHTFPCRHHFHRPLPGSVAGIASRQNHRLLLAPSCFARIYLAAASRCRNAISPLRPGNLARDAASKFAFYTWDSLQLHFSFCSCACQLEAWTVRSVDSLMFLQRAKYQYQPLL